MGWAAHLAHTLYPEALLRYLESSLTLDKLENALVLREPWFAHVQNPSQTFIHCTFLPEAWDRCWNVNDLPPPPLPSPWLSLAPSIPFPLISANPHPLARQGSTHMPPPPKAFPALQPVVILTVSALSTGPDLSK